MHTHSIDFTTCKLEFGASLKLECKNNYNILIYIGTTPPPWGIVGDGPNPQVWGTVGSGLTPRVQKSTMRARFPALISVGGADRFLEDLSPDVPGDQYSEKVV